jgi:hypothetical protein
MKTSFHEWIYEKLLREMTDSEAEQILGVKRGDPNLMNVYMQLAKKHHPDHGGDLATMQKVNAAKDVLTGAPKPKIYWGGRPSGNNSNYRSSRQDRRQNHEDRRQKIFAARKKVKELCEGISPAILQQMWFSYLQKTDRLVQEALAMAKEGYYRTPEDRDRDVLTNQDAIDFLKDYYSRDEYFRDGSGIVTSFVMAPQPNTIENYNALIDFIDQWLQKGVQEASIHVVKTRPGSKIYKQKPYSSEIATQIDGLGRDIPSKSRSKQKSEPSLLGVPLSKIGKLK